MECWWFWHQPHRDLSHSGPERGKCVTIWPTAGEENRKQISLYSLSLCYPSMPPSPRWEKYWESKHSLRVTASIKYQVAENGKRHLWSFLEHVSWKRKHRPKLRWSKTNVPSPAEEKKKKHSRVPSLDQDVALGLPRILTRSPLQRFESVSSGSF